MFDLGWVELSFLAILALIVVGPKDLPKLARGAGKLWGRVQRLYRQSLQSIHKLETEIELASGPDGRQTPDYYELLPEHVRRAMETAEPSRDAQHNQEVEAMYNEAMKDLKK
ncbi:Sec-independent protein translocase subunit TatA/TatB [Kineobactrum salinum]|uniref:Preprotein translocase subunit TatB n=1 Tax=Kineobactrum salinum TaxID=2708301 RepID=A0A6C0U630_9GAMM|nr:twin-arginine translocase TatA/TatE family subunit [Kineobactrum salinum]QIB64894.1 preprotein translocase subunit TatB [Kineobactrum salinum]